MRISGSNRKIVLLLVAAGCIPAVALAAAQRERIAFTAKCWSNGNGLPSCVCTYNALVDLPANYRSLAMSWAHDSGTAYATGVMQLIAAETWRVGSVRFERLANFRDREEAIRTWVWRTADAIGWAALKHAAPEVAGKLAPVAAVLPLVDDALGEFAKAQDVLGRHCGTGKTFLVRVYETRRVATEKLEALTAATVEATKGAGIATAETTAGLSARLWGWAKSLF
jgi:hypothetical protein